VIGRTLSHYKILEKLGSGGMEGEVYLARDSRLERDVALKLLPPNRFDDEETRKQFRREALALSKLNHPNVQTVFDFDSEDGTDFLVTEYVPGVTLSDKLSGEGLPEAEVIELGSQLAAGLAAAHAQGIVHGISSPGTFGSCRTDGSRSSTSDSPSMWDRSGVGDDARPARDEHVRGNTALHVARAASGSSS